MLLPWKHENIAHLGRSDIPHLLQCTCVPFGQGFDVVTCPSLSPPLAPLTSYNIHLLHGYTVIVCVAPIWSTQFTALMLNV